MAAKNLKPIKPSLKEKKRYIAFEIISEKPIGKFASVSKAIWDSSLSFMGELGVSKAGLWILPEKWNEQKQTGLLRVSNKSTAETKAALSLIKTIDGQKATVKSKGTSGMIGKLAKYTE